MFLSKPISSHLTIWPTIQICNYPSDSYEAGVSLDNFELGVGGRGRWVSNHIILPPTCLKIIHQEKRQHFFRLASNQYDNDEFATNITNIGEKGRRCYCHLLQYPTSDAPRPRQTTQNIWPSCHRYRYPSFLSRLKAGRFA